MFDLEYQGNITEAACVINYDISDLHYAILESESIVTRAIDNYKKISSTLLTEGASEQDMQVFTEAAINTIRDKAIKMLTMLKEWVLNKIKEIKEFIRLYVTKTSTNLDKILPILQKNLSSGKYKDGPIYDMYKFTPDAVNAPNVSVDDMLRGEGYDFSWEKQMKNIMNDVTEFEQPSTAQIKYSILKKSVNNVQHRQHEMFDADIKDEVMLKILGDKKIPTKFDMSIIDTVKNLKQLFDKTTKSFDNIIDDLNEFIKREQDPNKFKIVFPNAEEDTVGSHFNKIQARQAEYVKIQIHIVSTYVHTLASIQTHKLNAISTYATNCMSFCMAAYQYKKSEDK